MQNTKSSKIKVTYNNTVKVINSSLTSFNELTNVLSKLFTIPPEEIAEYTVSLCDKDGETDITDNHDFTELILNNKEQSYIRLKLSKFEFDEFISEDVSQSICVVSNKPIVKQVEMKSATTLEFKERKPVNLTVSIKNTGNCTISSKSTLQMFAMGTAISEAFALGFALNPGEEKTISVQFTFFTLEPSLRAVLVMLDEEKVIINGTKINVTLKRIEDVLDFLDPPEEITKLPLEQKKLIRHVVMEEMTTKSVSQIHKIFEKHGWNLQSAIEDLAD